ncbi:MAG TPA: hypothetical protein VMH02_00320 [Verrucomicrobiae bacterium]|nr:hypothetical protein [Verrucomicrobiae bacterium]
MGFRRDPIDPRHPERLTASAVLSLILHVLFAALFFAVLVSSSQQGATENVSGGEIVTFERRSPVQLAQQPSRETALPVPHVPRIAPLHHAPVSQPAHQRLPQNLHELSRYMKNAPPNPLPIPRQSVAPVPQPTQNVYEPAPAPQLPAAPLSIPTVAPVAVAPKAPPTVAPPAPTARPTLAPAPKAPAATSPPTRRPATPAPAAPTTAPSAVALAVRPSAAPSSAPAPAARASVPPAPRAGVPSPSPTSIAAVAKTAGTAPTPGPKGVGSPGPSAGTAKSNQPSPQRPIRVRPTPTPAPAAPPRPSAPPSDINAKLRALLPHNPVDPSQIHFVPHLSLRGRMEPTPPPNVLAETKFLYETRGTGDEARVKMWVVAARKAGPTTICTGWLVRYPETIKGGYTYVPANDQIAPANGTQIGIGGGHGGEPEGPFAAGQAPIVEGMVSRVCDGRLLVPFAESPGSSP